MSFGPLTTGGAALTAGGEILYVLVGDAAVIWVDAIHPRQPPDEPIIVRAHLADAGGEPVGGGLVSLALAGVTIVTPNAAETDETGTVTFSITPTSEGVLSIQALADGAVDGGADASNGDGSFTFAVGTFGLLSSPLFIEITAAQEPIEVVVGQARRKRQRRPEPLTASYLDIGPIAAAPRSAAPVGLMSDGGLHPTPMQPGMDRLAQHLGGIVADQESKLAADIERFQESFSQR